MKGTSGEKGDKGSDGLDGSPGKINYNINILIKKHNSFKGLPGTPGENYEV
jgi:hypothetical protein